MSHDGCKEVAWRGQAFPYLIHHPNAFLKTENYGSVRNQAEGHASAHETHNHGSDSLAPAGTGTWNGPAPRGYIRDGINTAAATTADAAAIKQPETVRIGSSGVMPMLGLGTACITTPDAVKSALELGYRHFDCAAAYKNQEIVGAGLADFIASGRRSELYVVSKLWIDDRKPERVRPAVEKCLAELGCQYLDLYLIHWPEAQVPGSIDDLSKTLTEDKEVTIQDTWRAMEALVDAGLVKAIGVSNFSVKQVEDLLANCRIRPVCNQVELHPYLPQRKLVGVCFRKGVQCVAYSPLGGQGVVGPPSTLLNNPVVIQVAKEAAKSPAQVLLRWNLQRGVPVIPKASSPEHLKQNIQEAFNWSLSPEHKAMLDALEDGTRFINVPWHQWADPEEGGVTKPSLALA